MSQNQKKSEQSKKVLKKINFLWTKKQNIKLKLAVCQTRLKEANCRRSPKALYSYEKKKSIEYLSDEYEDLMSFRNKTNEMLP